MLRSLHALEVVPVLPFGPQAIGRPALIMDALLGAPAQSSGRRAAARVIEAVNANGVSPFDLQAG